MSISADGPADAFPRRIPLIVATAFFMETLDSTIITTALPAMARSLGESTLDLTASVTVYLVAMTVFVPAAGWASDRFGARNLFAAAVAVFTLASLLCGVSPSFWTLIAARALQGGAAAFMSPVGRLIVLRETPKHRIIDAIGLIVWPGLIAPVIGPPLGGFITTYASWRWIFLLNIPIGLLGVYLVLRFVPKHAAGGRARFDAPGFVLTAAALATLIHGLSLIAQGGAGVVSGGGFVAIGIGCGFAAVRHALRHPAPMLDLGAVAVPTFAFSTVTAGLAARVAISMTPFLLPLMFQIGFGASAFEAGIMLLVYMAGNLAMKSVTTPILHRFGFRDVIRRERRAVRGVADRVRVALAQGAPARRLRRAVRRRHDPLDELHGDEHARIRRRARVHAAGRHHAGGDGAAGGRHRGCGGGRRWRSGSSRRSGTGRSLRWETSSTRCLPPPP